MIAFLTSSPCIYGAPRAILNPENSFIDNLFSCLPAHPRCLFICSAPDDPGFTDRVSREMAAAFQEAGMEFSRLYKLDRRNQKDAQMLIWKSDFIILSGGHVPTQNKFFQEIGLKEMLKNYQGVILGISAGTMNAATRVYAQPEEAGESVPEFKRFLSGLGITHVNVLPHYQKAKYYTVDGQHLYDEITREDSMGHCFYVLPDGSYIYQDENAVLVCGEAYLYQDGVMTRLTGKEEVYYLDR